MLNYMPMITLNREEKRSFNFLVYVLTASFILTACDNTQAGKNFVFNIEKEVRSADVVRNEYPGQPVVYLYQGNGRFGSSFGPLGLHLRSGQKNSRYGKTQYLHLRHVGRGKFGSDYLMPMAEVYWADEFKDISDYRQHQSFYDGTITTSFETDGNAIGVNTWSDPVEKDLSCITIEASERDVRLVVDPLRELKLHYDQAVAQKVAITKKVDYKKTSTVTRTKSFGIKNMIPFFRTSKKETIDVIDGVWEISLECMGKKSLIYISTNTPFVSVTDDNKLFFTPEKGKTHIMISYGTPAKVSVEGSLERTKEWWHRKWDGSGFIKFTDENATKMWVRSMAMFLSSYGEDKGELSPPMGYSSNGWPFYYPQDVSYVHPVLLSTGNTGIARSWIEYWAGRIDGLRAYTKRLYGVDGVLAPWVFPYGDFEGYHDTTPPNKFYYEIHNSGYLARMAHETAVHVNDQKWMEKYAIPLIEGCAEFYRNICTKGEDGLWHQYVEPSMGQDERGGMNQRDYLCALYSARYCFQRAVEYGLDADGTYSLILKDGLAFENLRSERGFYFSCAGSGEEDFGKQKHPVQLNELAFLPVNDTVSHAAAVAYGLRYDITARAREPYFYGWTLGEFLLAGSRMGAPEQWLEDWDKMDKADYVDPEWIQIYETSGDRHMPFYNITNGLVAQSLLNNLVCDWYGRLEIAKCNPWQGKVYVKNIRSLLGVTVSGRMEDKLYDITLTAWKDTEFMLGGELIKMIKGERMKCTGGK